MTRRVVIEIILVAIVAAAVGVAFYQQAPVPRVRVGNRTWTVAWAVPAENTTAGGDQLTNAFPSGRAHDQTLRQIVDLSLGGAAIRIRLTNELGDRPLRLARMTIAPALTDGAIDTRHMHQLAFSGSVDLTIPPGIEATSDAVPMVVTEGQRLAISMAVVGTSPTPTMHQFAGHTSFITAPQTGDRTRAADGHNYPVRTTADFWLATAEVLNPPHSTHAVAALGDSQTDAYFLNDGDMTWPASLRQRLLPSPVSVIDSGLTGNTVVDLGCTNCGPPMVDRVIRDAVNLPGVDTAIVQGGTNDITHGATAAQIVHGLASIAAILHAHGIRAILMTIPPRVAGSFGWRPATMEPVRVAVNGWLRAQRDADGLIDADRLLSTPAHQLAPPYQRGDGTHLSALGRYVLAGAIPLTLIAH